jgi:hypothetical protein
MGAEHIVKHQFKPGQSGNPSGRHPRPLSDAYAKLMAEKADPKLVTAWRKFGAKPGATNADIVSICLLRSAVRGKPEAAKELREGIEGKAPMRVQLEQDAHIQIDVTFEDPVEPRGERLLKQNPAARILESDDVLKQP